MSYLKSVGFGLILLASSGGVVFAQSGAMSSDSSMDKPMTASKSDMMKMDKCKSMDHDMMMKDHTCMKMMKMHPDMMKSGQAMDNGMMQPK